MFELLRSVLPYLNPFRLPMKKETLDAWAKIFEDCTKVSLLAIPALWYYGKEDFVFKFGATVGLFLSMYICIIFGRLLRDYADVLSQPKTGESK